MELLFQILLLYIGGASLVALVLYGVDKGKAKRGAWRISEKALLLSGFLGGAIGALLAMQLFRHKTRHYYFYAVNVLGLAWQAALAVYLFLQL